MGEEEWVSEWDERESSSAFTTFFPSSFLGQLLDNSFCANDSLSWKFYVIVITTDIACFSILDSLFLLAKNVDDAAAAIYAWVNPAAVYYSAVIVW